jgi:hypothetical protein
MVLSCLAYSSTLKMEAICSCEKAVDFRRTTQSYTPGDRSLHNHCCEIHLLLSSHVHRGLPSFPTKNLYALLISLMCVICPAHLILLDEIFLTIFCKECILWRYSLPIPLAFCYFLPHRSRSASYSHTPSICSSLNVIDNDSHPYKTKDSIPCILISVFLKEDRKTKKFWSKW